MPRPRFAWFVFACLFLSVVALGIATVPAINSRAMIGKQPDGSWLVVTQQVLRRQSRHWRRYQLAVGFQQRFDAFPRRKHYRVKTFVCHNPGV